MRVTERLRRAMALRLVKNMGGRTFRDGLTRFGSLEAFCRARSAEVKANEKAAEKEIEKAARAGVEIVTFSDGNYPALLKELFDPPVLLYVKGSLPGDARVCLGVVGSREASVHGLDLARETGRELAAAGAVVVSGLARGIDSAAHEGALDADGLTVAVLGCGLARMYPPENRKLAGRIAAKGALVSEFLMEEGPKLHHFPMRNRLISGLSRGVAVVEAREKSGALITADFALEQGRGVYVFPGNAGSKKTLGSNNLLKEGATPVTDASEILEDFGLRSRTKKAVNAPPVSGEEDGLLALLREAETLHLDEIVEKSLLSPQRTMTLLTSLAVRGAVRELPGSYFTEARA